MGLAKMAFRLRVSGKGFWYNMIKFPKAAAMSVLVDSVDDAVQRPLKTCCGQRMTVAVAPKDEINLIDTPRQNATRGVLCIERRAIIITITPK
jgi:hypothetical protein